MVTFDRHRCVYEAQHEHVAANVMRRIFESQPPHEFMQGSLGGLVGNQRVGSDGGHAADVSDAAPSARSHQGQYMLADQHCSAQINVEHLVPYPAVDLRRVTIAHSYSDIVVKDIDVAEF